MTQMSTVFSLISLGPSFQKMTHHFLLYGSLRPDNLEKNLKPWLRQKPADLDLHRFPVNMQHSSCKQVFTIMSDK